MSDNKSCIEFFEGIAEKLCDIWADTKYKLDEHVDLFLSASMIAIIDAMPNNLNKITKKELANMNEAIEELEYLHEFLKTNCRHNQYRNQP